MHRRYFIVEMGPYEHAGDLGYELNKIIDDPGYHLISVTAQTQDNHQIKYIAVFSEVPILRHLQRFLLVLRWLIPTLLGAAIAYQLVENGFWLKKILLPGE